MTSTTPSLQGRSDEQRFWELQLVLAPPVPSAGSLDLRGRSPSRQPSPNLRHRPRRREVGWRRMRATSFEDVRLAGGSEAVGNL